MTVTEDSDTKSGIELLKEVVKDLFDDTPELVDLSWQVKDGEVDTLRFHIEQESYEELLDYPSIEISEYLNKFGPITPQSLDWNNSINYFDLIDLKKNTQFYLKLKAFSDEVVYTQDDLLGNNKKVVFDGENLIISDL